MDPTVVTVATCALNQFALDFTGNRDRILAAVAEAKAAGASYLITPELCIPGYGCEDHFLEKDTFFHSVEVLAELITSGASEGMLLDVGMPYVFRSVLYNVRVFVLDGRIVLVRPKMHLANDGNYREERWFTAWSRPRTTIEVALPRVLREVTGQAEAPFGDGVLRFADATLGSETCEELFTPAAPHISMALDGVDIFGNGSGSHHELRKLSRRIDLIGNATRKCGGIYLYANQKGCDGGRCYYDGCAMIFCNGKLVAQGDQFSLRDVDVVTATVDLDAVRSFRAGVASASKQAADAPMYPSASADAVSSVFLSSTFARRRALTEALGKPRIPLPQEEIAYGPAAWLWDYLRRSGLSGYFVPLSGGIDSSATATIVGSMCHMVYDAVMSEDGPDAQVLADLRRMVRVPESEPDWRPESPAAIADAIFVTCYMGTSNSSAETRARAAALAEQVGSYHLDINIDEVVSAFESLFAKTTSFTPKFKVHGGSWAENLALQNIQARSRMVIAYLFGQLIPTVRGPGGGLLVLGSANVDEAIRGYYTKYDCSAADVNPIGAICKADLRLFMTWATERFGYSSLADIIAAPPTAELEPITADYTQTDEADMGMTYAELTEYGRLRKIGKAGPVSMFEALVRKWPHLSPAAVADKVKFFFKMYGRNRHKMTTLTPAYHAESYSPDDNRHDLRQFLYPDWSYQFARIDALVAAMGDDA
ncbi:carbon nitrogen hydrolase/NAD synthase [Thecamonas trahens ATCC 50062]|uniref:Glutamine-dependent NAD(+) synthetase n=1 Tax=Thecamonas trahens ATCC 50062 TaxID=461836 RepID=A0A0L0D606_THETB|nr:carbon nitrogen hydrolase/NAD synthase [Thecamonas trahens ATCC 50062]KNC46743.1 carbon nitrogen hydrolase/NAD synthase [Thecamonas trahens ATCC 50062]|eukprot:XP_013760023.1 carbon nitrogen hydrolase/NAD synthase [Thecamonas trahens ATCC 50062]